MGRTRENKFKAQTSAAKVMAGVLGYSEGILLGEFLKRVSASNSVCYKQTLNKFLCNKTN
jgi:hypothetical protein